MMPQISQAPTPYWQSPNGGIRIYQGDCVEVMQQLPPQSVHTCVTSPPYWGLRSYSVAEDNKHLEIGSEPSPDCNTHGQAQCGRCFVCSMVKVFRAVRRVLRDDGTLWLNLGDTYGKDSNLIGVPWRVALALQVDGWILRQDIIWSKPAPMPESVRNRCTKSHEYVFLFAKKMGYYYDSEAIKEKAKYGADLGILRTKVEDKTGKVAGSTPTIRQRLMNGVDSRVGNPSCTRNMRSVWSVSHQGFNGAHYAAYPPKLIEPCVLAGTSAEGCCSKCGAPRHRIMEASGGERVEEEDKAPRDRSIPRNRNGITGSLEAGCACGAAVIPCTVFDPFLGTATTAEVAIMYGRRCVGIELSEKYISECCVPRIKAAVNRRVESWQTVNNLKKGKRCRR